ncbi:hypothetical protein MHBO_001284 [Bonamia ostreae]|uniref:PUM-HD domain-containing protein n=1 Tax=Bonamia ostreae TaxID=126728 RepID=A0ABV2AJ16_9EUKA
MGLYLAIAKHTEKLVQDQFGNYIVQHALETSPNKVKEMVKLNMLGKFVAYSKQKFSSNVVEKCLKVSDAKWQRNIVRELIFFPWELINDKYGNYCLQTALSVCDKDLCEEFAKAVYPSLSRLRENVKVKWVNLLEAAKLKHQN